MRGLLVFRLRAHQSLLEAARRALPGRQVELLHVAQYALLAGLRDMACTRPPRVVCCVCGVEMRPGSEPASHSYCTRCEELVP